MPERAALYSQVALKTKTPCPAGMSVGEASILRLSSSPIEVLAHEGNTRPLANTHRTQAPSRTVISTGPFSGQVYDDTLSDLVLPDPFVTGNPQRARQSMPQNGTDIIDLTNSPPHLTPEIIDLDSLPDILAIPAPTIEAHRVQPRPETNIEPPEWRQRRRDWLLQTAQRRTQQREHRNVPGPNHNSNLSGMIPNLVGMMPDLVGQNVARFRAYIHGPNGGGPIRNAMGLPENFLPGSNISLIPHTTHAFQAPDLNYAIYNELFPGFQMPPQPSPPKYEAPAPLKDPFTRSFTDKDILICPGCRVELGGFGDVERRKVWVSKCSHVYCGECGRNIKNSAKRQGALCVATGCAKKITKAKIFEAYI